MCLSEAASLIWSEERISSSSFRGYRVRVYRVRVYRVRVYRVRVYRVRV